SRSHDVALAKLRGLGTGKVALLGLLEPLAVVVAAIPLGVLGALAAMRLATGSLLPDAVVLRPDASMVTALGVALAGAVVAAALGLRSTLAQPVLAQLVRATPASARRPVLVLEVVVVTAALAALWQVRARNDDGELAGLALLAPGLSAVAVAVVGARLLHHLATAWARRTRFRRDVAGFLAARQIGRRTGGARIAVIVTVATALAAFAASTWGLVERQRDGQAAMEVGAQRVYRVDAPSPGRLLSLVRDLDPTGRALSAAVQYPGDRVEDRVLAVDSRRLTATSAWQPAWGSEDVRAVARDLRTDTAPSLTMIGKRLSIGLDASLLSGDPDVSLVAGILDRDGREYPVSFGRVMFGPQTLSAETDGCLHGCRLAGLGLVRQSGQIGNLVGEVTFRSMTVDGESLANPFRRVDWRPARVNEQLPVSSPVAKLRAVPGGLVMRFSCTPSQTPGITRADVPLEIPLVAAGDSTLPSVGRAGLVMSRGLDGSQDPSRVVARTAVLPRLGTEGVLADLEITARAATDPAPGLVFQVWANERAPAPTALRKQLRIVGLPVVSVETVAQRSHQLGRTGSAMALTLLIGVALAALAVAVLAVLATALVQGRRRAYELVALRTAGVPEQALRRSSLREYAVQLGFGTIVGLVCGATTARLVGDSIAGLGRAGPVAPVVDRWEWAALALVAGVSVVLFAVVAELCARAGQRFAQVDLLRAAAT
ncbi:MAG TPA: FtsX-like permease family protein, partial [Mycobacteriales bacterium]|nr:FtsX-like permease family protein [Mycobacteriales bacterium]